MSACTFASAAINFGPLLSCSPDVTLEDGKALSSWALCSSDLLWNVLSILATTTLLSSQPFHNSRALREWLTPRLASRRYPQVRWGDAPRVDDNSRQPISSKQRREIVNEWSVMWACGLRLSLAPALVLSAAGLISFNLFNCSMSGRLWGGAWPGLRLPSVRFEDRRMPARSRICSAQAACLSL